MEVEIVNMKKLFPDNKGSKKGLMEFLDKKGFYIVLLLCIAIVGTVAIFVTNYNPASSNTDYDGQKIITDDLDDDYLQGIDQGVTAESATDTTVALDETKGATETATKPADSADKTKDDAKAAAPENKTEKQPADDAKKTAAPEKTNTEKKSDSKSQAAATAATAKEQAFIMPVIGDVTLEYAMDKPVYSKTLEDWRTHSGMDIAADRGTAVKAVADGVVSEIKRDPGLGILVIVDHQNGLKTVYANLASDDFVSPNQKVKQGDVIGSVGNTAIFESVEQSHLHFEVWKKDAPVNPADYLPKK